MHHGREYRSHANRTTSSLRGARLDAVDDELDAGKDAGAGRGEIGAKPSRSTTTSSITKELKPNSSTPLLYTKVDWRLPFPPLVRREFAFSVYLSSNRASGPVTAAKPFPGKIARPDHETFPYLPGQWRH